MSLEGPLRELGLQEVLQLLALSRKSGLVHVRHGRRGWRGSIALDHGQIIFGQVPGLVPDLDDRLLLLGRLSAEQRAALATADDLAAERRALLGDAAEALIAEQAVEAVEAAIEELFTWRDGDFRFAPGERPPERATLVQRSTDRVLMQVVTRAEQWVALGDRIAHGGMIPTFVELEPVQLPLLHLVPQEWEVLTQVDGVRDVRGLALALGRDPLDVARVVHGLIAAGMLSLRDVVVTERAAPTPPAVLAVSTPPWTTAAATPARARPAVPDAVEALEARGTQAARVGDFSGARAFWQAYLAARPWADDADRVREAVDLVTRLDQLLAESRLPTPTPR